MICQLPSPHQRGRGPQFEGGKAAPSLPTAKAKSVLVRGQALFCCCCVPRAPCTYSPRKVGGKLDEFAKTFQYLNDLRGRSGLWAGDATRPPSARVLWEAPFQPRLGTWFFFAGQALISFFRASFAAHPRALGARMAGELGPKGKKCLQSCPWTGSFY